MGNTDLNIVKALIKSVIISCPTEITLEKLNRDYYDFEFQCIPHRKFGYNSLEDFLLSIPDTVRVIGSGKTAMVIAQCNQKSAHIQQMVAEQKKPSNAKARRGQTLRKYQAASSMQPMRQRLQQVNRNLPYKTLSGPAKISHSRTERENQQQTSSNISGTHRSANEIQLKAKPMESVKPKVKEKVPQVQQKLSMTPGTQQKSTSCEINETNDKRKTQEGVQNNGNATRRTTEGQRDICQGAAIKDNKNQINALAKLFDSKCSMDIPKSQHNPQQSIVPFGQELPSYKFPDEFNDNTTCITLLLSEIRSPTMFWFHQFKDEEKHAVDILMEDLQRFYNPLPPNELNIPIDSIVPGQVCAGSYKHLWHRAEILNRPVNNNVLVKMLDFGAVVMVNTKYIKFLVSNLAKLPIQAMKGCLSNIKPSDPEWSTQALQHFVKLTKEKMLFAKITKIDKKQQLAHMILCSISCGMAVQINKNMLENEYGQLAA